jgi:hypothetical protein
MTDGRVSKIPLRTDVSRLTASTDRDLIPIPPERRTYVNYIFNDLPGTAANEQLYFSPPENLVLLHLLVYLRVQHLGLYCRLYPSCLWIECTAGHGGLDVYIMYFELTGYLPFS